MRKIARSLGIGDDADGKSDPKAGDQPEQRPDARVTKSIAETGDIDARNEGRGNAIVEGSRARGSIRATTTGSKGSADPKGGPPTPG
jgi:hypothetical protein